MRDKRPVDELSIEELERILMLRKRAARMERFRDNDQRRVEVPAAAPVPRPEPTVTVPDRVEIPAYIPEPAAAIPTVPTFEDDLPRFEDDLPPPVVDIPSRRERVSSNGSSPGALRGVLNKFLLGVEIAGFLGLVGVVFLAYQGVKIVEKNIEKTNSISATSEAELALRRIQPTATPVISINNVVLPGGHVYAEDGNHRFNLAEVPEIYRASFQDELNNPIAQAPPTPAPSSPILIDIPQIQVRASVRAGADWKTLQASVGHEPYSANPGEYGNMVLVGHNDIFGEIFRRLEELDPGDEFSIQAQDGKRYTYRVSESFDVDPSEVWVLDQGRGQDVPIVTLITCYPYRVNNRRWIVVAEQVST